MTPLCRPNRYRANPATHRRGELWRGARGHK